MLYYTNDVYGITESGSRSFITFTNSYAYRLFIKTAAKNHSWWKWNEVVTDFTNKLGTCIILLRKKKMNIFIYVPRNLGCSDSHIFHQVQEERDQCNTFIFLPIFIFSLFAVKIICIGKRKKTSGSNCKIAVKKASTPDGRLLGYFFFIANKAFQTIHILKWL